MIDFQTQFQSIAQAWVASGAGGYTCGKPGKNLLAIQAMPL